MGHLGKTYSQFTKHKQETQLNKNKGQCPLENILKHYAPIYIVRSYDNMYKSTKPQEKQ